MSVQGMRFENYFGEQPAGIGRAPETTSTRLELDTATLQSLLTIAGILERSAGSEAAVRLAALALRRALDSIICAPDRNGMS
jgi:hypothetical protein